MPSSCLCVCLASKCDTRGGTGKISDKFFFFFFLILILITSICIWKQLLFYICRWTPWATKSNKAPSCLSFLCFHSDIRALGFLRLKPLRLKLAGLKEVWVSFRGGKTDAGYDSIPQTTLNIRTALIFLLLKLFVHIDWSNENQC